MEAPSSTKTHSRQGSSGRVLPKRLTRGPLDISNSPIHPAQISPTRAPSSLSSTASFGVNPRVSSSPSSKLSSSIYRAAKSPPAPSRTFSAILSTPKDFSTLLNPGLYHTLSFVDTPPPFRNPHSKTDPSTSPTELIASGQFRSAAIKAAQILTTPGQTLIAEQIFDLIYKRLACLTLCNQTALAAQEVKSLEDLSSAYYYDEETGEHRVPWALRVLAVRLQGIGFGDVRRGVIGYYDLVSEARTTLNSLKEQRKLIEGEYHEKEEKDHEIKMWESRLSELGIRVASALIEMEDFEGATRFLATLKSSPLTTQLRNQQALLWIFLGDVEAARSCVEEDQVILALAYMAEAQFEKAVQIWEDLIATGNSQDTAMWKHNLAVSLIYLSRLDEARKILETLVLEEGHAFHALTFNLSTIYELCTERSRSRKINLAEEVAEMLDAKRNRTGEEGGVMGWEKVNGDFKL